MSSYDGLERIKDLYM